MLETTITMQELINNIKPTIDASFEYVVKVAETIVSHPIFLFTLGFLVVGVCIKFFRAMLSR